MVGRSSKRHSEGSAASAGSVGSSRSSAGGQLAEQALPSAGKKHHSSGKKSIGKPSIMRGRVKSGGGGGGGGGKKRGGGGGSSHSRRSGSRNNSKHGSDGGGGTGTGQTDELHVPSDHQERIQAQRRRDFVWDSNHAHGARLHAVTDPRPHKSCMKVATQEESLWRAEEKEKKRSKEGRGGGLLPRGLSRKVLSRKKTTMKRDDGPLGGDDDDDGEDGSGNNKRGGSGVNFRSSGTGGSKQKRNGSGRSSGNNGRAGLLSKMKSFASRRVLRSSPSMDEDSSPPSSPSRPAPPPPPPTPHVQFSTLLWRWYDLRAVDNPGVSKGIAIGAGWDYEEDDAPTPVDMHELYRTHTHPRRKLKEIRLTKEERERRLLNSGVTQRELNEMRKAINIAKKKRRDTLEAGEENMKNAEKREGMLRKLKKVLHMKKNYEQEEEDLWDAAQNRDDAPEPQPEDPPQARLAQVAEE